ncbi:hypothetical protein [Nocardia brasiliensis]|uniref:hypothetical protein n=1 Tax=Nocardia brasiliensis TaxID=37326 RepID=UPI0024570646|nr:hypothetical protein [Nocardia brasiliensis]
MVTDTARALGPICAFCSHENLVAHSRCVRCGAPLPEEPLPGSLEPEPDEPPEDSAPVIVDKVLPRPGIQWRAAVGGAANTVERGIRNPGRIIGVLLGTGVGIVLVIGGLLVVAALVLRQLLPAFDAPEVGARAGGHTWTDQIRGVATCGRINIDERCVITAGHRMLWGGVTGGRDLTFWIRSLPPDALGATVRRWRAEGGRILCDGTIFMQVSPMATVHYANARAGVAVETDPFTDRAGAQAFLTRSGALC